MKTRLIGEIAKNYVENLGGSLEVHEPDETCSYVYFDAVLEHPDHEVNLVAAREAFLATHMQDCKSDQIK